LGYTLEKRVFLECASKLMVVSEMSSGTLVVIMQKFFISVLNDDFASIKLALQLPRRLLMS
jgi:hypothetical protein